MSKKIFLTGELLEKLDKLRASGKKIVYSMGIFDIVHPGIINHLEDAKAQGDVLVVGVIKDKDVRRGPGRPVFNAQQRSNSVASLAQVDYVCIVDNSTPYESVGVVRPDVFAKGQTYKERDEQVHGRLFDEVKKLYFNKTRIYETQGIAHSSSDIIKNLVEIYPPETQSFIKSFKKKYSFKKVSNAIEKLSGMRVLLVGDGIIDEYHYIQTLNKSAKSPLVVHKYLEHEVFAGGAFIVANHLAGLVKEVQLVTLLGGQDSREDFVRGSLADNVEPVFFMRDDGPTIIKKRYINYYLNHKLFEVNYLNEANIDSSLERKVINHLKKAIPSYDIVMVCDFGHGLITDKVIKAIERHAPVLAINTQTNGANAGYNLITKYKKPMFVCLDEAEVRLAAQDKHSNIEDVAARIIKKIKADHLIVTRGKKGSFGVSSDGMVNVTPIFSSKVIDTVGAGDAFFAFTGPCLANDEPLDLVSFIGNSVGALAVEIMGNKKPVEKHELLEFMYSILK